MITNSNILLKNRRKLFSIIVFFTCFTGLIKAQQHYFEQYSVESGLSSRVYAIVVDQQKYIWMGTLQGVSKFNGHSFTNYTADEDGLAPKPVKSIIIDSRNFLWMGHWDGGITRYNGKKFEHITNQNYDNDKDIVCVFEDIDGKIWSSENETPTCMAPSEWLTSSSSARVISLRPPAALLMRPRSLFSSS